MLNFKIRVLVVDDFPTMRRIIKNLLKQLGFEDIDEAEDGENALRKLKSREYGLVIADWNMPVMDGMKLLKSIRSDTQLKDMPFLMITAEADKQKVIEAIKSGVDSYIVKPFTGEVLKEKLERIAEKKPSLKGGSNE